MKRKTKNLNKSRTSIALENSAVRLQAHWRWRSKAL